MRELWTFAEISGERILRASQEALCEAVRQGRQLRVRTTALVLGSQIPGQILERLGTFGPDRVLALDNEALSSFSPDAYTDALEQLLAMYKPDVFLMGSSVLSREVAPRLASRLGCGLVTEATFLNPQDNGFLATRSAYRPHASMIVSFAKQGSQIIVLAPKVMDVETAGPRSCAVEYVAEPLIFRGQATQIEDMIREIPASLDLTDANVIISGGRGMQSKENFSLLDELAEVLGGAVGASRMAVDMKWRPKECMVGMTGKMVSPDLYVACGISGAIQHIMGMQSSESIIAINTDPHAPIFRIATLGIVGDVRDVLPVMIESFREASAKANRQECSV
ncbi:MAG: electron transfer flavoprotein subunit alpha/FixB family protein [Candidatus Lindowbacteria bacterium]|nr:electron transfer flavoprotein subunit alpha/FixB family protein [Candidatus Lindowbacteria bacterium]